MAAEEIAPRITVDKQVRFGKPVVKGTRVAVATLLGHLSAGDRIEDLDDEYGVTREDILACLAFAAEVIGQGRFRAHPGAETKEIAPRITVNPNICSGRPVVAGTRIHVEGVVGALASGLSMEEIHQEYGRSKEDVLACLAFALPLVEEAPIWVGRST